MQPGVLSGPGWRCRAPRDSQPEQRAPTSRAGPPQAARARSPRPSRRFPASARPLPAAPAPHQALPAPTLPPIINKHFCFAIKEQRWRIILARAALAYVSMDIHLKIKYMPPPSGAGGSAAGRGGAADSGAGGGQKGRPAGRPAPSSQLGCVWHCLSPQGPPSLSAPSRPGKGISNAPALSLFKKHPQYLYILKIRFLATPPANFKIRVGEKGAR